MLSYFYLYIIVAFLQKVVNVMYTLATYNNCYATRPPLSILHVCNCSQRYATQYRQAGNDDCKMLHILQHFIYLKKSVGKSSNVL